MLSFLIGLIIVMIYINYKEEQELKELEKKCNKNKNKGE